ncbi:MAG: FKBP-type peptidyl-prolyl cis-trans isomerase [Rikenellaceae bacterium]|nr:FKBP-type peptidyl-prolyl cis-trans isomerase [Rikenellaceae bacterium]
MKNLFILAGILAVTLSSCGSAGTGSIKTEQDSLAYAIGVDLGMSIKSIDSTLNVDIIAAAMKDAIKGKPKMEHNAAVAFLQEYFMVRKPAKALEASNAFLAEKEKEANVNKTESGLLYEVVSAGAEKPLQDIDTVMVKYTGKLPDGSIFDQTGEDTAKFVLGQVIPGWTEGIKLVGKGGKIKLYIPSDLAYGTRGAQPKIGPNQALEFEVELIDFSAGDSTKLKK